MYRGQWRLSLFQSRHFGTSHSSPSISPTVQNTLQNPLLESPSAATNFGMTHFMPRSCIKISDTVVFGIPRSASRSRTVSYWSLLIAAPTHSTFSGVLFVAGLPERGSLSTDSQPSLKHLCHTFICAALITSSPKASWIIQTASTDKYSSLTQNWIQICCSTQSFWMRRLHSMHAHSTGSTAPTD